MPSVQVKNVNSQHHDGASLSPGRTSMTMPRPIMSTGRYAALSGLAAATAFYLLWVILNVEGEESPWVASGVAAGMTILACIVAREIKVRRHDHVARQHKLPDPARYQTKKRLGYTATLTAATTAIRRLERRLREIERRGATPVEHLEACRLCEQYLKSAEETLPTLGMGTEVRAAVRAGQERVGVLRKRHLLLWARKESQSLTMQAQQRTRPEDKIELAQNALAVIDEALQAYPSESELHESGLAVREYIASVTLARWVTLAERAEFKNQIIEAADYYRDALFDLSRADISDATRDEAATRLLAKLQMLQAYLATSDDTAANENTSSAGLLTADVVKKPDLLDETCPS